MDIMGYKSNWTDLEGEIPEARINTASHVWDSFAGEFFFDDCKHKNTICRKVKRIDEVDDIIKDSIFAVKPVGDIDGHMMMTDSTLSYAIGADERFPIMPNYVRDLAGRLICISECFPTQKDSPKTKKFPEPAFLVDSSIDPKNLIENVFFSRFRTLEFSPAKIDYIKDDKEIEFYNYASANLHPYKLRVDSFYQDGWRVPQTEMLFAKKMAEPLAVDTLAREFEKKWYDYQNKQDYEAFYEDCGGEAYFNDLFEQGITLIPTLEAYNANPIVDRNFNIIDFNYGKFVSEFHDAVKYVDSDLPMGTIVTVVEPGYITYFETRKAKVIVSNGSGYVSDNAKDPDPLYPDLRLPHQRTSSKWGDVYIPTHPKHFETSAIWGWDSKTGMFMQEKGPIWDPLHYYYESTDQIIYAYDSVVLDDNYWLIEVPKEMKNRFYPVVPFEGYDIIDIQEKKEREDYRVRPATTCKRYTESIFSANIGYHSMPPEFEFEIDSWVMPSLSPLKRVVVDVPLNIREKLAQPILCNVPAKLYMAKQTENSNNEGNYWINDMSKLSDSVGDFNGDYPYLARYYSNVISKAVVKSLMNLFVFKDGVDTNMLRTEYMATLEMPLQIDSCIRDMSVAYFDLKEKSFLRLKNRMELFFEYHDEYVMSSWNCESCEDMTYMLKDSSVVKLEDSNFSSVAIMQPPTF